MWEVEGGDWWSHARENKERENKMVTWEIKREEMSAIESAKINGCDLVSTDPDSCKIYRRRVLWVILHVSDSRY